MFGRIRNKFLGLITTHNTICKRYHGHNIASNKIIPGLTIALFFVSIFIAVSIAIAQESERNDTLVVGVRADAPPFSSCKNQSAICSSEKESLEEYTGFSVDICKRIADKAVEMGITCNYISKKISAEDRFTLLQDGTIDMLCGATTVTLERMRITDFSLFTFVSGMSVMYTETPVFKKDGEKAVIKIGYLKKTTSENVKSELMKKVKSELGYGEDIHIDSNNPQDDHYTGVKNLLAGKINVYLADREILLALKRNHSELIVSQKYFTIEPYAIGLNMEKPELRFAANSVLSELFGDALSNPSDMPILDLLRKHFPGSRFSKSLTNLYRSQRLSLGSQIANPIQQLSCPPSE